MPPKVRVKAEPEPEEPTTSIYHHDTEDHMQIDDDELEEEDEIVREIDVYISHNLTQQLHLLQFPLQPIQQSNNNNYGNEAEPQAARIKPKHNILEVDHAIPNNIQRMGSKHLLHRTCSSHTVPVTTHLALGKMVLDTSSNSNNSSSGSNMALHLVPLTHITQMRPNFAHIDEEDDFNNPDHAKAEEEKAAALAKEKEKKPVMFQKKESERAVMARKNSYAYKKASEEGEEWHHLEVVQDEDSPEYEDWMKKLECPASARSQSMLEVPRGGGEEAAPPPSLLSYIHSLNYLPATTTSTATATTDSTAPEEEHVPRLDMKQAIADNIPLNMPTIGAHLTRLLCRGGPIPFSVLRNTLPKSVSDQQVLDSLAACAVMVRGNYVLQSRLMQYPRPVSKARAFVLLLLQSIGVVHRNRLEQVYGLSNDENGEEIDESRHEAHVNSESLLVILNQVARKTHDGWVLKVEDDTELLANFPENTAIHMQYWGRQMLRFRDYIERYAGPGMSMV